MNVNGFAVYRICDNIILLSSATYQNAHFQSDRPPFYFFVFFSPAHHCTCALLCATGPCSIQLVHKIVVCVIRIPSLSLIIFLSPDALRGQWHYLSRKPCIVASTLNIISQKTCSPLRFRKKSKLLSINF